MRKMRIVLAALPVVLLLGSAVVTPSQAQGFEERMHRLHVACERGERHACVQFGIMIGENRERHVEWRRTHPEWWWWEGR